MVQKYKHISFDLDGTLVHTIPEYRYALVPEVIKNLGGIVSDFRSIDRFWFESNRDTLIQKVFHLEPKAFWDLFRLMDTPQKRAAHTRAYDDAESTLRKLKQLDKLISIITGAPHEIAQMEIEKLNGVPHDMYISLTETFPEKPNPAGLRHVLTELNIFPEQTVYIGNSNEDAYFAKNAGVDFIYLERKEHEFDLKDYALATIHSLAELIK